VYLLFGEDEIEKGAVAHEFDALVDEGLQAFNIERIHAGDMTNGDRLSAGVASLIASANTLPMMAPRRVITVMQADAMLAPKRESDAAEQALSRLETFLKRPPAEAVVVFVVTSLDRRSRMFKLLTKQATLVECGVLETPADAERWVRNRIAAAGVQVDPAGARLLAERCGTDIARLRNDVERLLLYALGQPKISLEDVRQIVGPMALQDDWAMTNAIESGEAAGALRQLALMLDAGAPPEKVLGQLGWLVRTKFPAMSPGGFPRAVQALFRTDQDLKQSGGEPRVLLERLVVELCASRRQRGADRLMRPSSGWRGGS
jgi:DNA polymerase-3 subunit delta